MFCWIKFWALESLDSQLKFIFKTLQFARTKSSKNLDLLIWWKIVVVGSSKCYQIMSQHVTKRFKIWVCQYQAEIIWLSCINNRRHLTLTSTQWTQTWMAQRAPTLFKLKTVGLGGCGPGSDHSSGDPQLIFTIAWVHSSVLMNWRAITCTAVRSATNCAMD